MRNRAVGAVLALAFALAGPAEAGQLAEDGVRAAFDGYRQAVLKGQGARAGMLVSDDTRAFYDRARQAALNATVQDMEHMPLLEAVLVLRLRAALTTAQLRGLDGAGIIAAAASRGVVGGGLADVGLGPAEVYGNHAVAEQLNGNGGPAGVWWRFVREGGIWHVDLRPNLEAAEALLRDRLHASGQTRTDFLTHLVTNGR